MLYLIMFLYTETIKCTGFLSKKINVGSIKLYFYSSYILKYWGRTKFAVRLFIIAIFVYNSVGAGPVVEWETRET